MCDSFVTEGVHLISIVMGEMTHLRYMQGNKLAIHKSRVRLLAGHHYIVALGKLLQLCACHQSV